MPPRKSPAAGSAPPGGGLAEGPLIVGSSPKMQRIFSLLARIAPTDSPVLISGESGTGKELIARSIHLQSRRADRLFLAINCGALPENLLESELFGHIKGAFTGAWTEKRGLFEEADRGTLFLDEVGELPPPSQVKLLRVLQDHEVRRVGSNQTLKVDVRIVADGRTGPAPGPARLDPRGRAAGAGSRKTSRSLPGHLCEPFAAALAGEGAGAGWGATPGEPAPPVAEAAPSPGGAPGSRTGSWVRLLRRILEVDPLLCPRCGAEMKIVAVITEPKVVDAILRSVSRGARRDPFRKSFRGMAAILWVLQRDR